MANPPLDIFGNLAWLNKWVKNLLGRVRNLELNTAPSYKVYTALLTQEGISQNVSLLANDSLTVGVTYVILDDGGGFGCDFTNVGAPNNDFGTKFVATGITPNSWGVNTYLDYDEGAPVVTSLLENTIGNIWFEYEASGRYRVHSDGLFTNLKTYIVLSSLNTEVGTIVPLPFVKTIVIPETPLYISLQISSGDDGDFDNRLINQPIEIRVYN